MDRDTGDPLNRYPAMMTAAQVAEYTQISEVRLAAWRGRGTGPAWTKLGDGRNGAVRYPRESLRDYLSSKTTPAGTAVEAVS